MTLRLFLFGSPTVEYGGESVALPFERRNQLLVFLALKRSWVGRAELAAHALAGPAEQAGLHEPSQNPVSAAVTAMGELDRIAGSRPPIRS